MSELSEDLLREIEAEAPDLEEIVERLERDEYDAGNAAPLRRVEEKEGSVMRHEDAIAANAADIRKIMSLLKKAGITK